MWFNSPEFFYFFLPLALSLTLALRRIFPLRTLIILFVLGSLAFYGWGKPSLVALLVGSILLNYAAGLYVADRGRAARRRKQVLAAAIAANLLCLGVFKYSSKRILSSAISTPSLICRLPHRACLCHSVSPSSSF